MRQRIGGALRLVARGCRPLSFTFRKRVFIRPRLGTGVNPRQKQAAGRNASETKTVDIDHENGKSRSIPR